MGHDGPDSSVDFREDSPRFRRDRLLGGLVAALFSVALGIVSVAVPLLALTAGWNAAQIGLLVALTAVFQLITRSFMGMMMRRLPDKFFVVTAAIMIAAACGLIALSTVTAAFVASQSLQGIARAFFFTGNQTHAVRVPSSAVRGLTTVNLASGLGAFAGPALDGLLAEQSVGLTLIVGAAIGALALLPAG